LCVCFTDTRIDIQLSYCSPAFCYHGFHSTSPSYTYSTVVFHPCRQHDIKTTAAVFCLSSSRRTARSTSTVGQLAFPVDTGANMWNDLPFHITSSQFTVTRGFQTASRDFPLFSFLSGRPDMTYLLIIITLSCACC